MTTGLILFAHGARDPAWAEPLQRVRAAIRQQGGGRPVELAFLEFMAPTLPDCAGELIRQGVDKIVVLPMFIAQGGHLKRDLPEMLQMLRSTHPTVEFSLCGAVGENEIVIQAMARAALVALGLELA